MNMPVKHHIARSARIKTGIVLAILLLILFAALVWYKQQKSQTAFVPHAISPDSTGFYWFKNSIIYNLDVKVFKDSDGDGIGDFKGLIQQLPYLDSLGITAIWLAPFQPSSGRDDGYDITDYYAVDPRLGTLDDFKTFIQQARQHNMKVIIDLVLNHTSDLHPWFQQARSNPSSPYVNWYSWSADKPKNEKIGMAFEGVQQAIWTYDTLAKKYYYHRFYNFEPDLNTQNPAVQAECLKVIKHWVDLGIAGFREDAVPFFIEIPKKKGRIFDHQFELLAKMHNYLKSLRPDDIVLGEANITPGENEDFFGKHKDGLQMMFNFYVNQFLFYALATGKVEPLKKALQLTGKYPKECQWGQFLRNHDEIDLGRLSDANRDEVYLKFGPDDNMRLYNRGIRRRLAPMMNNDTPFLAFAYSLLYSLPSTPVIRYGEEIGMGDDLSLNERLSVRTPMQWSADTNAGFSTAVKTIRPVIDTGMYGYHRVNVEKEMPDSNSLLNRIKRIIRLRRSCPEIGFGDWEVLDVQSPNILCIRYHWQNNTLLVLHNLGDQPRQATISVKEAGGHTLEDLTDPGRKVSGQDTYRFSMDAHGYKWFRVKRS
jgi:maltose alpha-D-glucosyltransferase/alpha-amylase